MNAIGGHVKSKQEHGSWIDLSDSQAETETESLWTVVSWTACVTCVCRLKVDEFVSFSDAVASLMREMSFPEDRARRFIKHFDVNDDGQLSSEEFAQFTNNLRES